MIALLLFGLIAAASAAPHRFHHGPNHREHHRHFSHDHYSDDFFDTKQFWAELAVEMREVDEMLASFAQRFPSLVSQSGIEGNEYKINIGLSGFEEQDIVVKAKEGFLMVQAVHKLPEGGETMYLDAKTLPACVNVTGTWTFNQGILKIVFPLKAETVGATEVIQVDGTETPVIKDREEMDNENVSVTKDTDIELNGDQDKTNELFTNEIPKGKVEATTYAVDLKDEVEFLPVGRY